MNIVLFIGVKDYLSDKNRPLLAKRVGGAMLLFAVPVLISYFQYQNYSEEGKKTIKAIALQPNIDPYQEKYNFSNAEVAQLLVQLAEVKMDKEVNFIVTPETVFADNVKLQELPYTEAVGILRTLVERYPQLNWVGGTAMIEFITDKAHTTSQSNYLPQYNIWYNDYKGT